MYMPVSTSVAFSTTAPGNFTLPHNLGVTPQSVIFEYTSDGVVWFQSPVLYDATNLYLVASDTGITGFALVYATASPFSPTIVPGNSTIRLQEVVDDAWTLGDVAPALSTGGSSMAPALSIANDAMAAMINGGNIGQPYNWKWNRYNIPPFPTISLQQDYFIPNLVNLGWLESAWAVNINQTSIPKQKFQLEVHKDLQVTNDQQTYTGKISWLPNSMLITGTWGAAPQGPTAGFPSGQTTVAGPNQSGQQNPGPGVIYTNPLGVLITPQNATTCITDPNGNLWVLTTFGTCGSSAPAWNATPTYPTFRNPGVAASTVDDGTCVWTAINPVGQGIRLNPIPPQSGIVWLIQAVGQIRAPRFNNLKQLLNPIPDDFEWAFKQLFFAQCYRRNPDPKVRARFPQEQQLALEALDKAVRQADRELDDFGFVPSSIVMETSFGYGTTTPSSPYGPWGS
jgi:hypothetical protein